MKKLFQTIFVSALSILLFTMPAFAAAPEPEEIPVVAQSVQETAWAEATVVDGQASVQLEDGVQVTVSGEALDGLTLVVYQIPRSDEQAWAWMESCMEKYGTNLYPLDLFFMDSQGDRVEVQSASGTGHGCYIYHQSQQLLCAGRDRRDQYACRAG